MRVATAIAWRDLRATFLSAFGVGCSAGFVAFAGVVLVLDLRGNQARLDSWFAPLYAGVGVLAALLTMRSFADEERIGSLELLLTAPVRLWQVVAGKLLSVIGALAVMVALTLVCPWLVMTMGQPDHGPIITGYIGVALVGLAFTAAGLAVSAATGNPLVAATATLAILLGLWFGGQLAGGLGGRPKLLLQYLSPSAHLTGFLRGTVSVGDAAYFLSFTAVALAVAAQLLGSRR